MVSLRVGTNLWVPCQARNDQKFAVYGIGKNLISKEKGSNLNGLNSNTFNTEPSFLFGADLEAFSAKLLKRESGDKWLPYLP